MVKNEVLLAARQLLDEKLDLYQNQLISKTLSAQQKSRSK